MTGREKIIDKIRADSAAECDAVLADARKKADEITSAARAEAVNVAHQTDRQAQAEAARRTAAAQSSAALVKRNALLETRREEIALTVSRLVEYLINLDDKAYFDVLYRLAASFKGESGMLFLNSRDLNRLPSDFASKMKNAGIDAQLSRQPVDIKGGFILKNGDIDLSADFDSLVNEKRDALEDFINSRLFVE